MAFEAQRMGRVLPISQDLNLALMPKISIHSLFQMLEYAYRLKSFSVLEGIVGVQSIEEIYERLAHILSRRVMYRGRRGFHRTYIPRTEHLPYTRGRLDSRSLMRIPYDLNLLCHHKEHTADIEDNRILCWTLHVIARSGICSERVLPFVRQAYRHLLSVTTLNPYDANICLNRLYHRLNEDYQPLHALCRFFLENSGAHHQLGDHEMLPFLLNMDRLFELFVAEWLKAHEKEIGFDMKAQDRVYIDAHDEYYFDIDLVLSDPHDGSARYVLDTKYKNPDRPDSNDIAQIVAYAKAKKCHEAVLIYPEPVTFEAWVDDIRVRSVTFSLDDDVDDAGQMFLQDLFA